MNGMYQYPYGYFNQTSLNNSAGALIKVNGINGANAYQMSPNQTTALFDENEDYFYIKTTDGAGFPSIRTFRFEEVTDNSCQFVTREEHEKSFNELREMIKYGFESIRKNAD